MSSAARLVQEATISEKRWSSQPERVVEGTPPKPEDNPSTKQGGEVRTAVTGISPFYKSGIEQTKAEVRYGSSQNLQYQSGDYKVKESQEHNRMTIIDPKVNTNSNIPASQIFQQKNLVGDFPSQHTKRSFMNLDPLEQKRFKSLERRPVTTTNYLQESVERHREMEASKLKDYLKATEKDANKPWDKPDWPGPKQDHSESLRELEQMKHAIETLQKQVSEAPRKDDLDELSKLNKNLIERSKGLKKDFKLVSYEIIKTDPEPVPDMYKTEPIVREFTETYSRIKVRNDHESSNVRQGNERIENIVQKPVHITKESLSPPTDDKPKGIIKPVVTKPRITETIKRIEETRRTEEVERRVQRREKKHRSHRYHHDDHYMTENHYSGGHRSSSMNRNGLLPIGYYPGYESYNRSSTTRRDYENGHNDGQYHYMNGRMMNQQGRYDSSLSDSLRRGDVRYNPNGEIRESYTYDNRGHRRNSNAGYGMHKSYSTRDVFRDSNGGYYGSYYRNPPTQPFVEFPPTLPRRHGEPPIPPPHRSASQMGMESQYRPISKSHSYADWSDQRNQNGNHAYGRRHDEEMSKLENEFRDSLLVPLNNGNGNINDYEHRVEQIPGGYEEYSRSVKGNSGRRLNRDGVPTDFREQSHSYSFHREQAH